MKILNCPLCKEQVFSELEKGCKMCGMPLENKEEFCSAHCEKLYDAIYNKPKNN